MTKRGELEGKVDTVGAAEAGQPSDADPTGSSAALVRLVRALARLLARKDHAADEIASAHDEESNGDKR